MQSDSMNDEILSRAEEEEEEEEEKEEEVSSSPSTQFEVTVSAGHLR